MKKQSALKVFASVVSILLVLALVCGVLMYFTDWGKDWSKLNPNDQTGESGAIITEGESHGMKLASVKISPENYDEYGISPLAETAYRLTATITPDNATNKAVDWAVTWAYTDENVGGGIVVPELRSVTTSSGSWANGAQGKTVTDYVTVTPTADGALTANVECLKDFGEQVRVTVTSRDNSYAKATAMVDYVQKLQSVKSTFGSTVLTDGMTKSFDLDASGQAAETWKHDYSTSSYTIADEYTTMVKISFADGVSAVESAVGVEFTWEGETITGGMPSFDKTFFDKVFVVTNIAVSNDAIKYNKLVNALSSGVTLFEVEVSTTGEYSSKTDIYQINVTSDGSIIRVEGVDLDDTSIVF